MVNYMAKRKKRSSHAYGIGLTIYIAVVMAIVVFALTRVWKYAEEYEASRPNKLMDEYVEQLSTSLWDTSIAAAISQMPHEMQTDEECEALVKEMLADGVRYVRQAGNVEGATSITYSLRCGNSTFGKVTLIEDESKADELSYDMLPWKIYSEEFDFSGLYTSVEITVPASFSVEINGNKLSKTYIVESGIHYDVLEDYYESYPDLPTKVVYRFDNAVGELEPIVYDEGGNEFVIDETKDDSQYLSECPPEQLDRFGEFTTNFLTRYQKYCSSTGDTMTNYHNVLAYVKKGSDLEERLAQSLDGYLSWSHTSSFRMDEVTMNGVIYLGDGVYSIDASTAFTTVGTRGEEQATNNFKIIVTYSNDDIRAVSLDTY